MASTVTWHLPQVLATLAWLMGELRSTLRLMSCTPWQSLQLGATMRPFSSRASPWMLSWYWAPTFGQILTPQQQTDLRRSYQDSAQFARQTLSQLSGRALSQDQADTANRIRSFLSQADEAQSKDRSEEHTSEL